MGKKPTAKGAAAVSGSNFLVHVSLPQSAPAPADSQLILRGLTDRTHPPHVFSCIVVLHTNTTITTTTTNLPAQG
jgi:hypothetical protein